MSVMWSRAGAELGPNVHHGCRVVAKLVGKPEKAVRSILFRLEQRSFTFVDIVGSSCDGHTAVREYLWNPGKTSGDVIIFTCSLSGVWSTLWNVRRCYCSWLLWRATHLHILCMSGPLNLTESFVFVPYFSSTFNFRPTHCLIPSALPIP